MNYCCAIVPTYNHAGTLEDVLTNVAQHVQYIIVVNDGSTDNSVALLSELQERFISNSVTLEIINFAHNKGKGTALQKGFERAIEAGFRYALTIDSNGQHCASEIPKFFDMIEKYPDNLIIGARKMRHDGTPRNSSRANRFLNYWYKITTGLKIPDTRSGFRLYPIERLKNMRFFTGKYEFEVEILVRAAWSGCRVRWTPIKAYFAPKEKRISHFRSFRDLMRMGMLNMVLVLLTFLWIRPRDTIARLNWQIIKRFVKQQFGRQKQSAMILGLSMGFGVFMGIIPIWGVQILSGLVLAHFMKLNKALVFIGANISFVPMIPIILYISFIAGSLFVRNPVTSVSLDAISFEYVKVNSLQYFIGSIFFAIVAGTVASLIVWLIVALKRKYQKND